MALALGFAATGRGLARNVDALEQKPNLMPGHLEKTPPTKEPGGLDPYLDGRRKAGPTAPWVRLG